MDPNNVALSIRSVHHEATSLNRSSPSVSCHLYAAGSKGAHNEQKSEIPADD